MSESRYREANVIRGIPVITDPPSHGDVLAFDAARRRLAFSRGVGTTTTAAFTQPALNGTVNVTVQSTAWMNVGHYLYIASAGTYRTEAKVDATTVTLKCVVADATGEITSGKAVSPAGQPGSAGASGADGLSFTHRGAWSSGTGYVVRDVVSHNGSTYVAKASTNVAPPNATYWDLWASKGTDGTSGTDGVSAFARPDGSQNWVTSGTWSIDVQPSTAWMAVGQVLLISGCGYVQVTAINSPSNFSCVSLGYPGEVANGALFDDNNLITPSGVRGAAGTNGVDGKNAYTNVNQTNGFTQPAVSATVDVVVANTSWMAVNQVIFVATGGYYKVTAITAATNTVTLQNLGYSGNANQGANIANGSLVTTGGLKGTDGTNGTNGTNGTDGANAYTTTTASFTQPEVGSTVTVSVSASGWMAVGQVVYVAGGGVYEVATVNSSTSVDLKNLGGPKAAARYATVGSNALVTNGSLGRIAYEATFSTYAAEIVAPISYPVPADSRVHAKAFALICSVDNPANVKLIRLDGSAIRVGNNDVSVVGSPASSAEMNGSVTAVLDFDVSGDELVLVASADETNAELKWRVFLEVDAVVEKPATDSYRTITKNGGAKASQLVATQVQYSTKRSGCYARYFRLTCSVGTTLTISMSTGGTWDTYVYLTKGTAKGGAIVASDDDSGTNADSLISNYTTQASDGTEFVIECTSYGQGATGTFTLQVT